MRSTLLKPLYNKAVKGLPGLGTPAAAAQRALRKAGSPEAAADHLVPRYTSLCGATGFVSGLPGFLLLPVTLPANLAGVALLQLHMNATFAVLAGEDPHDSDVRDRAIACLLDKFDESGQNTEDEEVATRTSVKLAERAVRFATEQATRFAVKAARGVALSKVGARRLPLVGGFLSAGSDAYATTRIAQCARQTFLSSERLLEEAS
ncbi:MAG: hypothetical protein ACR2GR_06510 [Rhodothermales bacterium]